MQAIAINPIIPIGKHEFSGSLKPTVNARELHGFLGVSTKFTTWINRRIEEYGFENGTDFVRVELPAGYAAAQTGGGLDEILASQKWEAQETNTYDFGQQGRIEYALTLDMAKELSMVERTDKGKQARQYFIECERRAQAPAIPQTLPEALRLAADLAEQVRHQQARLAVAERQAAGLALLSERGNARNLTQAAKELKTHYRELLEHLRAKKWVCNGKPVYATAKALDAGYMLQVAGISERNGASYTQALITAKGLAKLSEHFGAVWRERQS